MPHTDNAQLLKNLTTTLVPACGNIPVVSPGHPENSAIIKLLKGPCTGTDGGMLPQMPNGCSAAQGNCLQDEYFQLIKTWIERGAPND